MYEKLGRMMGRSYEDTVQILNKALRNAESQTRIEIMLTFEKVGEYEKFVCNLICFTKMYGDFQIKREMYNF